MVVCREFIYRIHMTKILWWKFTRSALSDLILKITGNQVAIKIPQYGEVCSVASSCLDSEKPVVLLEVFLGVYDLFVWLINSSCNTSISLSYMHCYLFLLKYIKIKLINSMIFYAGCVIGKPILCHKIHAMDDAWI